MQTLSELLAQLESHRDRLRTELSQVEGAIVSLRGHRPSIAPVREVSTQAEEPAQVIPAIRKRRSRGDLQDKSTQLLFFIGKNGETALQDALAFAGKSGPINPDSFRTQMHGYVQRGWLVRPKKGYYLLTPEGAEKCHFDLVSNSPTGELDLPAGATSANDPYNIPRRG